MSLPTPPRGASPSASYRFSQTQGDSHLPVAFDPCRPIHYVIRPDNAPEGGELLIHDAVARTGAAAGMTFVFDGGTDEAINWLREGYQPARYGDRWAPVLITWATVEEEPGFAGAYAGRGGPQPMREPGTDALVYVTGQVALSADLVANQAGNPAGGDIVRGVIQHELGHGLGLAHVPDPMQLMHDGGHAGVADFAAGDRAGLAVLHQQPCAPGL